MYYVAVISPLAGWRKGWVGAKRATWSLMVDCDKDSARYYFSLPLDV